MLLREDPVLCGRSITCYIARMHVFARHSVHPRIISNAYITCILVPVLGYLATTYTVLVSTPNECIALEDGEPQVCLLYIHCLFKHRGSLSAGRPYVRLLENC